MKKYIAVFVFFALLYGCNKSADSKSDSDTKQDFKRKVERVVKSPQWATKMAENEIYFKNDLEDYGEELPVKYASSLSDNELITSIEIAQLHRLDNRHYENKLICMVKEIEFGEFVDYKIGYYRLNGEIYELIKPVQVFGGYKEPVVGRLPVDDEIEAIYLEASSLKGSFKYVYPDSNEVVTFDTDEGEWITIKEAGKELDREKVKEMFGE